MLSILVGDLLAEIVEGAAGEDLPRTGVLLPVLNCDVLRTKPNKTIFAATKKFSKNMLRPVGTVLSRCLAPVDTTVRAIQVTS